MVTDSLAALTSGLNAVEEKVQEIDKKLADEPRSPRALRDINPVS